MQPLIWSLFLLLLSLFTAIEYPNGILFGDLGFGTTFTIDIDLSIVDGVCDVLDPRAGWEDMIQSTLGIPLLFESRIAFSWWI
jgi:hypothetical protein